MITSRGWRVAAAVSAACLLVLGSACSRPALLRNPKKTEVPSRVSARPQPPVPVVADPWRPGMPQLGIDVYWASNPGDSAAVVRAKARRIINYAVGLDANSIGLTFPVYTYGITSDAVYASPTTTPSPAHIAIFMSEAAKSHIRVTLRPLLNEAALIAQNPIAWRGSIEPADRSAWFESYKKLLMRYALVAESGHAATLVIGTELNSLEGDPRWPSLIRTVRPTYHGELLYDENFDEFAAHDTNLPLARFGVDAYPRFQLPDSASVSELANAWEGWLGDHRASVRKSIVLSEVGITAVSGSYQDPADWTQTSDSPVVPVVQMRWYKAVCRAVSVEQIGGIYWWEVSFDADPAHPGPFQVDRITFLGRPAQQVIKDCFAKLASGAIRSANAGA